MPAVIRLLVVSLMQPVFIAIGSGTLQGLDFTEVTKSLKEIDGVIDVKHLNIWAMNMERVTLSVVLAVGQCPRDGSCSFEIVLL